MSNSPDILTYSPQKPSIILDFDGTVSDAAKEAKSYTEKYISLLAAELKMTVSRVVDMLEIFHKVISENPGKYGWIVNGLMVAPATADPYLMLEAKARAVLDLINIRSTASRSEAEIDELLKRLFSESYPHSGIYFKDDAEPFIKEIRAQANLVIVTNSSTHNVRRKLAQLHRGQEEDIQVIGDARKYIVDDTWKAVPREMYIRGLARPIYLRRRTYGETVQRISNEIGPVTAIAGDIPELDILTPQALSSQIKGVLVGSVDENGQPVFTSPWDIEYFENHPSGAYVTTLKAAYDELIESLQ